MRHVPTLLRRELGAYFLSPMAFLILLAFQVIAWLNFWELIDGLSRPQQSLSSLRDPLNSYISASTAKVQMAAMIWFRVRALKKRPIATNIIPMVVRPRLKASSGPGSK